VIRLRIFVFYNIAIIACVVWRVLRGGSVGSTIIVGFLTVVTANGALAIKWLRTKDRPKAVTSGQFPWRLWGRGNALGIGALVLIALQGYGAADLAFFAILVFGAGILAMVVSWLWDRRTLRRRGQSEQ
jgi:hypothetical protein